MSLQTVPNFTDKIESDAEEVKKLKEKYEGIRTIRRQGPRLQKYIFSVMGSVLCLHEVDQGINAIVTSLGFVMIWNIPNQEVNSLKTQTYSAYESIFINGCLYVYSLLTFRV